MGELVRAVDIFDRQFATLVGPKPFSWQRRLFERLVKGDLPSALDLPTGLGKTSVIAIWLIARAHGAKLPRRLIYVVDRRAVVDQATTEAEKLRKALEGKVEHFDSLDESIRAQAKKAAAELNYRLGFNEKHKLPISTLRGAHVDNREWLDDPASPAIIVGTVDMIGSRLLFEGYGVSRKMRPYQAGLFGVDALIVLDEAHLVPPFAHLLRAIEQDASLKPKDEADRALLPRFVVLPLSATQRELAAVERGRTPFRLEEEDWKTDYVAKRRLEAKKRLRLEPLAENDPDNQLAKAAWELATKDGKFSRVVVFCERRDKSEDGRGPSAQGVAEAIKDLANGDRKTGRARVEIHEPELLVGARRVRERTMAAERLRELAFIGEKKPLEKPAFLVATAAGEVGVDIDADHMVSDIVAWERMVQRLGRVNRRGEGDSEIKVFWRKPSIKDTDAPTEAEKRALTAFESKAVIENLPHSDGTYNASPGALRQLAESARKDAELKASMEAATTPEPLRPALNRALVDAWSMTSLETHTGRPDVAPWLRGWVEEKPQTTVIWRKHLPVRIDDRGRTTIPSKKEIESFFEAAPPHESEGLETETYRVVDWLQKRAEEPNGKRPNVTDGEAEMGEADGLPDSNRSTEVIDTQAGPPAAAQRMNIYDIAAIALSRRGDFEQAYTLNELAKKRDSNAKKVLEAALAGRTLVIDARLGGITKSGLLDAKSDDFADTADSVNKWSGEARFRVQRRAGLSSDDEAPRGLPEQDWRFEHEFVLRRDHEGIPQERLIVEHFRDAAQKEDSRSISKPQELTVHQDWARSEMSRIAKAIGLSSTAANALAVGAALHDEGKKAPRWQRAFKAARDANKFGLAGPLAKTRGPIDQAILDGYRHEFGSLPHVEEKFKEEEFKALPEEWRELVLHLVAAHHGRARPVIETRGCDDGPPSMLEERACAVALRFARLQKRWGPWGLAWWEALMRAADQQASRDNEEGQGPSAIESTR